MTAGVLHTVRNLELTAVQMLPPAMLADWAAGRPLAPCADALVRGVLENQLLLFNRSPTRSVLQFGAAMAVDGAILVTSPAGIAGRGLGTWVVGEHLLKGHLILDGGLIWA